MMNTQWMTIAAIIGLGTVFVLFPVVVDTFSRYRKTRVLTCPETEEPATVDIDARRAALTSAFGRPILRVKNCTLWPKRRGCAQNCLKS